MKTQNELHAWIKNQNRKKGIGKCLLWDLEWKATNKAPTNNGGLTTGTIEEMTKFVLEHKDFQKDLKADLLSLVKAGAPKPDENSWFGVALRLFTEK